jgi:hypothetical protein
MTNPARPTRSEIFTAYNKARASARKAGNVKQIERLNKALGILLSKSYYEGEKATYQPTYFTCGCKDWQYRHAAKRAYTGGCKHMLAESLLLAIAERRANHEVTSWVLDPYSRHVLETACSHA